MKTKTILATLALSSLALAQPAAGATRSFESLPDQGAQSTAAVERVGSIGAEDEAGRGAGRAWIIVLAAVLVALLIALSGGNKSPG